MTRNYVIAIIVVVVIALGGWYFWNNKQTENTQNSEQLVGGDRDEHGCIGSAGYTWSSVKNSCIRLFEDGIRLNPKEDTLDQTQSAFLVFKSQNEYQMGELYLPGHATPTMVTFKQNHWEDQDGNYRLFEAGKNIMVLDSGSRLIYATDNQ